MTGTNDPAEPSRMKQSGFNLVLPKPFRRDYLQKVTTGKACCELTAVLREDCAYCPQRSLDVLRVVKFGLWVSLDLTTAL